MGPVSLSLAGASFLVILLTRRARDRSIVVLAWCLFASLMISLAVHACYRSAGRPTPLMLLDAAVLYVTGLTAICRFDGPKWLYILCGALALQCLAHLAYVCGLLPNNGYVLVLNLLFTIELGTLLLGSRDDLAPAVDVLKRTSAARRRPTALAVLQPRIQ
jgi:hypothetical protein